MNKTHEFEYGKIVYKMPNAIEAMRMFDALTEGIGNHEYCSIVVDKYRNLIVEIDVKVGNRKIDTFEKLIEKPSVTIIGALEAVAMDIHNFIFIDENKKKDAPN